MAVSLFNSSLSIYTFNSIFLAGKDFISLNSEILIPAGNLVHVVELSILDDDTVEENEQFSVLLSTEDTALVISTETAVVQIEDNDRKKNSCYFTFLLLRSRGVSTAHCTMDAMCHRL